MNFNWHNLAFSGGKIGIAIDNTQTGSDGWIVSTDEHEHSQVRFLIPCVTIIINNY